MKETMLKSQLFDMYYNANFVLDKFKIDNEPFLRDLAIKNYTYNTPPSTLRSSIMQMLTLNPFTKRLKIHKDFPSDLLADIFRPFLYNYLLVYYNFNGLEKNHIYEAELDCKLERFYKYNPDFGRKYIEIVNVFGKIERNLQVNTNHLNFYNKKIHNRDINIGDRCYYVIELDTIHSQSILDANNYGQNRVRSTPANNLYFLTRSLIANSQTQNSATNTTPRETPNSSPSVSPTASHSQTLFTSEIIVDIYNQINNELSDDTISETNEETSVS